MFTPPTCDCQLPVDYQQIFLKKRIKKVERFASILHKLGFHDKAEEIRNDKSILIPEEFNAVKAWIEYINRIFGVLAGLFSLAFAVFALVGRQPRKSKAFALLGLLFLIINAWIGSVVVATNLLPGLVSVHFLFSFLSVFSMMLAMHHSRPFGSIESGSGISTPFYLLFGLLMVEIFLGTVAREMVETKIAEHNLVVEGMLDFKGMGVGFMLHRFIPASVVVLAAYFYRKYNEIKAIKHYFAWVFLFSFVQICFGAFNIVFVLPPIAQVGHIVLGSLLPVMVFYFILTLQPQKEI